MEKSEREVIMKKIIPPNEISNLETVVLLERELAMAMIPLLVTLEPECI